jgi:hypothetical protein
VVIAARFPASLALVHALDAMFPAAVFFHTELQAVEYEVVTRGLDSFTGY